MRALITIAAVLAVTALGFAGGLLLLWKENIARRFSHFVISFGAGALLGIVFFDLLPEALEGEREPGPILLAVFGGLVLFYIIEKFFLWYHCHSADCGSAPRAPRYLIVLGDFVHNAIDGMVLAVTFAVDIRLGLVTAVGVILHEVPQETGDFAILLSGGLSRARVIVYNICSGAGALLGAGAVLLFGERVLAASPWLLAVVAGNFLYIAAVDLLPATHHHDARGGRHEQALHVFLFIAGAALLWLVSASLHG